jgi:hypothetical protein
VGGRRYLMRASSDSLPARERTLRGGLLRNHAGLGSTNRTGGDEEHFGQPTEVENPRCLPTLTPPRCYCSRLLV